jgi:DNA-binding transcriptional MocR family regulator
MVININRNSNIALYLQIKNQLREMILNGVLPQGFKLPPERRLAEQLKVNRSTVLNAYNELKADGLIESQIGRGTLVIKPEPKSDIAHLPGLEWRQFFSTATQMPSSVLQDTIKLLGKKEIISFALGTIPTDFYPLDLIGRLQCEVLESDGVKALSLLPTEGYYPLRESICQVMNSWGDEVNPEEILIVSGSQQGISLASKVFIESGDIVITEDPTFFFAAQVFRAAGARLLGIPVDGEGMCTDVLESTLQRCRPKLIYTIPSYQNPTGTVMSLKRRRHLLDLAYRYQIPILEDDPCGKLYFGETVMPTIKSLDQAEQVMYLSTFTKMLYPGIRIGWLAAPKPVIRQFTMQKQMDDLHSASLIQFVLDRLLKNGLLEPHLSKVREAYRIRCEAVCKAMKKYAPPGMVWQIPEGGLYLWCQLPPGIHDAGLLLMKAVENGVSFMPGEPFFTEQQDGVAYIRLNFTNPPVELLEEGIKRLTKTIKEMVQTETQNKNGVSTDLTALM